jgi:hypothetical protein
VIIPARPIVVIGAGAGGGQRDAASRMRLGDDGGAADADS